jgi:hypothetical protein
MAKKVGLILLILGTLGIVVCTIISVVVLNKMDNLDTPELWWVFSVLLLGVPISFILFIAGWFSYPRKTMTVRSAVGWMIFFIAAWFEIFLAGLFVPPSIIKCIGTHGYWYWCDKQAAGILIPSLVVPAIVMIFGLMLVYIKRKDRNVQQSNQSGQL